MIQDIWNTLQSLYNLLTGAVDALLAIVEYVHTIVIDSLFIVTYIGKIAQGSIIGWFGWMPVFLVSVVIVLIAVAVVYKLLGRE